MTQRTQQVLERTRRLLDRFGPRGPGSEASRGCADALAEEAQAFADSVETQDFPVSPGAFLGWVRVLVVAYGMALAALWVGWYPVAALVMCVSVAILIFQFFLYKEVLDPLFPKSTGRNVWASLEPKDEVRGELIISGHHDSARIFNFLVYQPKLYALRVNGGIGSLLFLTLTSSVLAVFEFIGLRTDWAWIPATVFSAMLVLVLQLWFFASAKHTPGAGDNLASSSVAWEFLNDRKLRRDQGEDLRHLRITVASWDAEEAGLRGVRAWRKSQGTKAPSHPMWNLNLECLYGAEDLFFLTSDINGSQDLSESFAQRCADLLRQSTGHDAPCKPIAFLTGGTDAGETARAGVVATTLMGMPWATDAQSSVYHTPKDTVDAVSPGAVEASLALAEALALDLDRELSD